MEDTCHATPQTECLSWHAVGPCVGSYEESKMSERRSATLHQTGNTITLT